MDSLYNSWFNTCNRIVEDSEASWKRDKDVHYMLEHVHGDYANVYLDLILFFTSFSNFIVCEPFVK